jgi:hypothetical protein
MAAESNPEKERDCLTDEEIKMLLDCINTSYIEDSVKAKQEAQDQAANLLDLIKDQEQAEESQKHSHEIFMQKREELQETISGQFYSISNLRQNHISLKEPNTLIETPEAVEKRTEDLYNDFFGKYLQPSDDGLKNPESIMIVKDAIREIKQRVMLKTYICVVRLYVDLIADSIRNPTKDVSVTKFITNFKITKEHFEKSTYTFDDGKMLKDLIKECKFEILADGTIEMLDRADNDPLRNFLADLLKKFDPDAPW